MSKASISRHINEVEARLGIKLCERGPGGFQLTEGGEVALSGRFRRWKRSSGSSRKSMRCAESCPARWCLASPNMCLRMRDAGCRGTRELQPGSAARHADVEGNDIGDLGTALVNGAVQIAIRGAYRRTRDASATIRCSPRRIACFIGRKRPARFRGFGYTRFTPRVQASSFRRGRAHDAGIHAGPEVSGLEAVAHDGCHGTLCRSVARALCSAVSPRYEFAVLPESPHYLMPFCAIVEEARPLSRSAEAFFNLLLEAHG